MRHKVLLYNPRAVFFDMPLALLAVGSNLDRERFEVVIIDTRVERDPEGMLLDHIDDALCLGVTVLTGAPIADALEVTRLAKRHRPELPTIWGGWHPSLFPRETAEHSAIDIVVQGQGEETFREVVETLSRGEPVDDLAGTATATPIAAKRPLLEMDAFAPPDFSLVDVEQYFALKGQRQLDYITSTGCPFRCAFCADPDVYERKYKTVASERLVAELESLWHRYRFTDLNFQDETFFVYGKRVEEIAQGLLERDLHFSWAATMRADQGARLSEESFALCKASGLRRVLIGVESGSANMIANIRKDTTLDQVMASAEMCLRHDVAVILTFIVGFPGETEEEVRETLDLINRLRSMSPKFQAPLFYYKPYPGTHLTRGQAVDLPVTLEQWANFDYVGGVPEPWMSPRVYRQVESFKFYCALAWGSGRPWLEPLRGIARARCRSHNYSFPVEKLLAGFVRKPVELS